MAGLVATMVARAPSPRRMFDGRSLKGLGEGRGDGRTSLLDEGLHDTAALGPPGVATGIRKSRHRAPVRPSGSRFRLPRRVVAANVRSSVACRRRPRDRGVPATAPPPTPPGPALRRPDKALRPVTRTRDDIVQTRVSATNQLHALLEDLWPGATTIFADIEFPISEPPISLDSCAAARPPPPPPTWARAPRRVPDHVRRLRPAARQRAAGSAACSPQGRPRPDPDPSRPRRRDRPGHRADRPGMSRESMP